MAGFLANTLFSETFTTTCYFLLYHRGSLYTQFPAQGQWQPHVFDRWCVCLALCVRGLCCSISSCSATVSTGFGHFLSVGDTILLLTMLCIGMVWLIWCVHGSLKSRFGCIVILPLVQLRFACLLPRKIGDGGHKQSTVPHQVDLCCCETRWFFGGDMGWNDIVSSIMGSVCNGGPFEQNLSPSSILLVHFGINAWGVVRWKVWNRTFLSWGSNICGFKCEGVWRWYSQPILAIVCLFISVSVAAIQVWSIVADYNFVLRECCTSNVSPASL